MRILVDYDRQRVALHDLRAFIASVLFAVTSATSLQAADAATNSFQNSMDLTLDQLVNIQVTSVSKKETSLNQSPAAITVITQEDIQRSGLNSIPELLRLVPGMDVAQIGASEWAISVRGFNTQYEDKLLVLVDGRSIYNPTFGGVRWDVQDLVLDDLDRIEVIRGPGATLWGANAANGVINIITKSAKETQGVLVSTSVGTEQQPSTSLRYGGEITSNLFYRVYVKYVNDLGVVEPSGNNSGDGWNAIRSGLRLDWDVTSRDHITFQGDYYHGEFGQSAQIPSFTAPYMTSFTALNDNTGGNALTRWTHEFSEKSDLSLQMYYDHAQYNSADFHGVTDTYDLDFQHKFGLGERNDIVWGAGYRYYPSYNPASSFVDYVPNQLHQQLAGAFVQDEITLIEDRLHFTLGTKVEHNDYTGFEYEPSGRIAWTPTENQTVWGAISRAIRTPSETERGSIYNQSVIPLPSSPPALVQILGNPDFQSEKILSYELGYRIEPTPKTSFDVAAFYTTYDSLESVQSAGSPYFVATPTPHLVIPEIYENAQSGDTYGVEVSAQWKVTSYLKLTGSYSLLEMSLGPAATYESDPKQQFQLHSYLDLPYHLELNTGVYFVDQIHPLSNTGGTVLVPSYIRVDVGATWHPCKSLEIGLWGQNLLDNRHAEFPNDQTSTTAEIPRGVYGKVTWHF